MMLSDVLGVLYLELGFLKNHSFKEDKESMLSSFKFQSITIPNNHPRADLVKQLKLTDMSSAFPH